MARPKKATTGFSTKISPQPIEKNQKNVDLNLTDKKIKNPKKSK